MNTLLKQYIEKTLTEFDQIPTERKVTLKRISEYISKKLEGQLSTSLIYVCTHNSRRSHLGQVWAKTASVYFNIPSVNTYSAGTEITALNPNIVLALTKAGFIIHAESGEVNPHHLISYDEQTSPLSCFSKTFNDLSIPKSELCCIMTCTEADGNCPVIPGTELRVSCPYEDPKVADGTRLEERTYDERCRQIARENLYLFSLVKK